MWLHRLIGLGAKRRLGYTAMLMIRGLGWGWTLLLLGLLRRRSLWVFDLYGNVLQIRVLFQSLISSSLKSNKPGYLFMFIRKAFGHLEIRLLVLIRHILPALPHLYLNAVNIFSHNNYIYSRMPSK